MAALTHYDHNGHWNGNGTHFRDDDDDNDNDAANTMARTETALDWFQRSSLKDSQRQRGNRKRHRRGSDDDDNDCNESSSFLSASTDVNTATDPSMAAHRFLRFGKSGIAPIDAAWKRSNDDNKQQQQQQQHHQWHHRPLQLRQGQHRHLGPHQQQQTASCSHDPPVVILEGPKDVGKTWMLLTLAARFVVSTRASRFKDTNFGSNGDEHEDKPSNGIEVATNERQEEDPNNSSTSSSNNHNDGNDKNHNDDNDSNNRKNYDRPKVLLLDSCFDFSVCQLVNVLRSTLRREREKQKVRERCHPEQWQQRPKDQQNIAATNKEVSGDQQGNGGRELEEKQHDGQSENKQGKIEEELERQELERTSLERDMEDCLSRIHIIQVDGPNGWVPTLEALTHRLSEERDRYRTSSSGNDDIATRNVSKDVEIETSLCGPPTLLLWDGFLSDVAITDSKNTMAMTTAIAMGGSGVDSHNNAHALFDNPVSREILRQVSRLLQEERDTLWWVLTARTTGGALSAGTSKNPPHDNETAALPFPTNKYESRPAENSGIGFRVTEWIRKEEELREQKQQLQQQQQHPGFVRQRQPQNRYSSPNRYPIPLRRASYRVRLDRLLSSSRSAGEGRIPRNAAEAAALVAKVIGRGGTSANCDEGSNNAGNHRQSNSVNDDQKIPYSISLGGILS